MDFRKKLILLLGILAGSAVVLVFVSYRTTNDIHTRLNEVRALDKGINALFDLNMLASELETGSVPRIRSQWRDIHENIDDALAAAGSFEQGKNQIQVILHKHEELDKLTRHLLGSTVLQSQDSRHIATQQLQIVTSSMLSETQVLFGMIYQEMQNVTLKFTVLVLFWGIMLVGAIVAIVLLVKQDVLSPLHQLRMDTEIIAGGNLEFKARLSGSREMQQLAQAFNLMTESLSKTLVSKALLARNEERFRQFFEVGLVGNAIVSPAKEWVLVNERLCSMLQYSESELKNLDWDALVSPDDWELENKLMEETLAGGRDGYNLDRGFVRKDGEYIHAKIAVRAVRDGDGEVGHLLVMVEDISDRVNAMEQVLTSNRELEQFAYVASHDLQEPLRMVASFTELLQKRYSERLDGDGLEFMGYIVDGARRMQTLIQDLLMYSRVGRKETQKDRVSPSAILEEVAQNLSVAIAESGATITYDKLPDVIANGTQLTQLFQNLIGNAIKFRTEPPPQIKISAEPKEALVCFRVSDNGIGMDKKYSDRVFQIFQRLHSRSQFEGTGIGLAVCRKIVAQHGGQIWFESTPGNGTQFYFTLKPVK